MRNNRICFIRLVAILLATVFSMSVMIASAQPKTLNDSLQSIDKLFEKVTTSTPGGVLSISRKGEILYRKAFGMADLEHNEINTTETIFEAGSVSKQFTAAAVLLLVKEGEIGLKDDIRKYFPDFPNYGSIITIEHLLHHTSGLRDWGSVAEIGGWPRGTRKYTPAHVKEIIWRQKQLNFIPGSEFGYSNSNYNMLVFLVEKVSGKTFQQFTNERIFTPLEMTQTRWRDNYRAIVPGRSIGYSWEGMAYEQNMPFENTIGHAALLTTVGDLEKWNRRWKNNALGKDINVMQETKGVLNSGETFFYACGVILTTANGFEEISHNGATAGYRSLLIYYPQKEISVVFLSNDAGAQLGRISSVVSELFLGKEDVTENKEEDYNGTNVLKESFAGKTGLYKHVRIDEILQELSIMNDSLAFKQSGIKLVPITDSKFAREGFILTFPPGEVKPKTLLMQDPNGDTATYVRVNPFVNGEKELNEYTGTFQSEEADAVGHVTVNNGMLVIHMHSDTNIKLSPAFADALFDDEMNFYRFIRDGRRRITGFTVSNTRVRNLLFKKIK